MIHQAVALAVEHADGRYLFRTDAGHAQALSGQALVSNLLACDLDG